MDPDADAMTRLSSPAPELIVAAPPAPAAIEIVSLPEPPEMVELVKVPPKLIKSASSPESTKDL